MTAAPRRIVSLVPSLTDTVAAFGLADRLVGVTDYCVRGAPDGAVRVGGSKYPDVDRVLGLDPDLVLANQEENRADDVEALRAHGIPVHLTFPVTVDDVGPMLAALGRVLGAGQAAGSLVGELDLARTAAARRRPAPPLGTLTLIWRKPWMALGSDTYAGDLLARCGFANVLAGSQERYPTLRPPLDAQADVVLLPSEPYRFTAEDLPAVTEAFPGARPRLVDGELLTWHGPRTTRALQVFTDLAVALAAGGDDSSNGQ